MKVTLMKDYRKFYTLDELDVAKKVIEDMKQYEESPAECAAMAVREALRGSDDWLLDVITAKASTAKNCRIWNRMFEGSEHFDVWIEATAKTGKGYIEIGAYLSDIWETGAEHYKEHMYIQYYKRQSYQRADI